MGLFGKLFEKKECSICGGEIGMLGNRKLEDGNMCKECAKKLSPFFSDRKNSTVAEINAQLAYRTENERSLDTFNPTVVIGHDTKVYIDMQKRKFIVTRHGNWRGENPDLIDISQVISCTVDIDEHKDEIYDKDADGNRRSYSPPRYNYSYSFDITINVNSPYFNRIGFELSDRLPDSIYSELYHQYEREAHELQSILSPQAGGGFDANRNFGVNQQGYEAAPQYGGGQSYGSASQYSNRQGYGNAPQYGAGPTFRCDKCGWIPTDQNNIPSFCPECGDRFDANDMNR